MKVEVFNICDFAQADSGGKLSVIGIFDTVWSDQAPATYGFCSIAVRVRFDKSEDGLKRFKISFIDADGKPALPPMETQILVTNVENALPSNVQIVSLIQHITFPNFGEYSMELEIDGKNAASTPLHIRQTPPHP